MSDYLSLNDLFVVGLAFDLVGAVVLAQGLLASPTLVVMRSRYGAILVSAPINTPQVIAEVRDRVSARAGLMCLLLGFLLQGAGYLLSVSGVTSATGGGRVLGAVVLAAAAAGIAVAGISSLRRPGLRRGLVAVAEEAERYWREHKAPATGYYLLLEAGQQLGWISLDPADARDAIRRAFRVKVHFIEQGATPHLLRDTDAMPARPAE